MSEDYEHRKARYMQVVMSTGKDDWETPKYLFDKLDARYHFTLDPCSNDTNYKVEKHYTIKEDGLKQDWGGHVVWCNPPYGREMPKWIKKAYEESLKPNTIVVMLIPARTDTVAFHKYIYNKAQIAFLRGRIKFVGATSGATFPSMIVVFGKKNG